MNVSGERAVRTINSEAYGTIEVTEEQLYHFPKGIIGFPQHSEYAIVQVVDSPFHILHAVDGQTSFILLPAYQATDDYSFAIDRSTTELLEASQPEDVATYVIVNIVDEQLFVNLKAPILMSACRKGVQFIIDDPSYTLRHPLARKEGG